MSEEFGNEQPDTDVLSRDNLDMELVAENIGEISSFSIYKEQDSDAFNPYALVLGGDTMVWLSEEDVEEIAEVIE